MADREGRIKELEDELSKTKYNKATQGHFALVKAKIAKLKEEIVAKARGAGKTSGYSVRKSGDASVALLGFPSVGKSTLLNTLTAAESKTAAYAFTTLDAIPGMLEYKHAKIQIVDIPGIVKGAAAGVGRGKEVLGVVRAADLILILVNALEPKQVDTLFEEVYDAGIRVHGGTPQVVIKNKARGGIKMGSTVRLTHVDQTTVESIMHEFRIMNADVVIREDVTIDRFIDAIQGNRVYIPSLLVFNKIDMLEPEAYQDLRRRYPDAVFIAAEKKINLDQLKEEIYKNLGLMSIFLKEPGKKADLQRPLIVKRNSSIRMVCEKIHRDFVKKFRYSKVWGASAKFPGQKFTLEHVLADGDIVEIVVS